MSFPRSPTRRGSAKYTPSRPNQLPVDAELHQLPTMEYTRRAGLMQCYQDLLISAVEKGKVPEDKVEFLEWAADFFDNFADQWENGHVNDRVLALLRIKSNAKKEGGCGRTSTVSVPKSVANQTVVVQLERGLDEGRERKMQYEEEKESVVGELDRQEEEEKHTVIVQLERDYQDEQLGQEAEEEEEQQQQHEEEENKGNESVGNTFLTSTESEEESDHEDFTDIVDEAEREMAHAATTIQRVMRGKNSRRSSTETAIADIKDESKDTLDIDKQDVSEDSLNGIIEDEAKATVDAHKHDVAKELLDAGIEDKTKAIVDADKQDVTRKAESQVALIPQTDEHTVESDTAVAIVENVVDVSVRRLSIDLEMERREELDARRTEQAAIEIQRVLRGTTLRRNSADQERANEVDIAAAEAKNHADVSADIDRTPGSGDVATDAIAGIDIVNVEKNGRAQASEIGKIQNERGTGVIAEADIAVIDDDAGSTETGVDLARVPDSTDGVDDNMQSRGQQGDEEQQEEQQEQQEQEQSQGDQQEVQQQSEEREQEHQQHQQQQQKQQEQQEQEGQEQAAQQQQQQDDETKSQSSQHSQSSASSAVDEGQPGSDSDSDASEEGSESDESNEAVLELERKLAQLEREANENVENSDGVENDEQKEEQEQEQEGQNQEQEQDTAKTSVADVDKNKASVPQVIIPAAKKPTGVVEGEMSDSREAAAAAIQARVREAAEKRKVPADTTTNLGTVSLV